MSRSCIFKVWSFKMVCCCTARWPYALQNSFGHARVIESIIVRWSSKLMQSDIPYVTMYSKAVGEVVGL